LIKNIKAKLNTHFTQKQDHTHFKPKGDIEHLFAHLMPIKIFEKVLDFNTSNDHKKITKNKTLFNHLQTRYLMYLPFALVFPFGLASLKLYCLQKK